jgi:hypothetical protein
LLISLKLQNWEKSGDNCKQRRYWGDWAKANDRTRKCRVVVMVASINCMNVQDFSWSRQDVSAVVDLDSYNGQSPVTIRPIQVSPNSCGGYVQCSMYPTCQTFRILSGGSMFNAYFSWSKAIVGPWLLKNLHFWWPSLSLLRIFYIYNASTQYCYRVTIGQLIEDCLSEISGNLLEKAPEM